MVDLPSMGISLVPNPTYRTTKTEDEEALILKWPESSVWVEIEVPFTVTVAPLSPFPFLSVTVPETDCCIANGTVMLIFFALLLTEIVLAIILYSILLLFKTAFNASSTDASLTFTEIRALVFKFSLYNTRRWDCLEMADSASSIRAFFIFNVTFCAVLLACTPVTNANRRHVLIFIIRNGLQNRGS